MPSNSNQSELPRHERPIDDLRSLKVICIGAGASGILAGIRLPQKIPNLDLTIFEKNEDVGGTWFENKYPGVASDIPSHGYQYSFADNHDWDHFYASGAEVYQYLRKVAKQYDVKKYVKFSHVFKGAKWLEEEGKWEVIILRLEDNETFVEKADVVIKATGILNTWKWPDIPGLHSFMGKKIHTARYDTSFEPKGKSVAVIGTGSTGIQLVPALQPIAGHVVTYSRSKAWVSPQGPYAEEIRRRGGDENFEYTTEEKEEFSRNPEKYAAYRREIENRFLKLHPGLIRGTEAHKKGAAMVQDLVKEKLAKRPDIFSRIKPEYPVGCKRLGAGPGYLEALCADNVELVTCGIKQIVADGIVDTDGTFRRADAIICATGFDTTLDNHAAPIFGQDNTSLDDIWQPEPQAYLGVCAVKTPNMFFVLGPNGAPMASFIAMAEFQVDYIVKAIQKIQREHIKSMVISECAKVAFVKAADKYFEKTVLTENCASWLKSHGKADGRIQAIWPGALGHARYTYEHPRWEDFEYEILPDLEDNPMGWMGNGMTMALVNGGNLTDHLDNVDIPPILNTSAEEVGE